MADVVIVRIGCRYQREMTRLTVQLRNKKEAMRAAERDAEVPRLRKWQYMCSNICRFA